MDHRPHIVVVEDEAAQRQLLVDYLGRQNFRVSSADGGITLRKLLERELPQLVLLDVGLPGEDGFVLARWLRERSGRIGIIMVTAATDTVDRVVGLETGADDYIGKPYAPAELLARIEAVLRRTSDRSTTVKDIFDDGVLRIDYGASAVTIRGDAVSLTPLEFRMLATLAENAGQVLSRGQLLELVWGDPEAVGADEV